jgi:hypothetical protein
LQALYVNSPAYLRLDGISKTPLGALAKNWILNTWWPLLLGGVPRRSMMFSTPPTKDDAVVLIRLVEEGKLRVSVKSVFCMVDTIKAYERVTTLRTRGKVIVKVEKD